MAYMSKRQTDNGAVPVGSNLYGTCSTDAYTQIKRVSMPDFNVLVTGVTIHVYFSYTNYASAPYLQVGSTAAKRIWMNNSHAGEWEAGGVISFTYDGTDWTMNDVQPQPYVPPTPYVPSLFQASVTTVFTVGANTAATVTLTGIARSGYTSLGVVGFNFTNTGSGEGVSHIYPYAIKLTDNDTLYVQCKNLFNSAVTVTLIANILYYG